jgi:hypothetical protein
LKRERSPLFFPTFLTIHGLKKLRNGHETVKNDRLGTFILYMINDPKRFKNERIIVKNHKLLELKLKRLRSAFQKGNLSLILKPLNDRFEI